MREREFIFPLSVEVSSEKVRKLKREDYEKLVNALKDVFDEVKIEFIPKSTACSHYLDCDDEAVSGLLYFKEINEPAYVHICISDPEDVEAMFHEFWNSPEVMDYLDKVFEKKVLRKEK